MFDVKPTTSTNISDCGACAMTSLLKYYGVEVTLEQMIKDCNVSIGGSTGKDLLQAGRKHGLDMKAWKMPAEDMIKNDRPTVAWWKYNHWVVCCGIDDETGKVIICNSTRGRYGVSKSLFKAFFSGIALSNGVPEDLPDGSEEVDPE